MQTIRSLLDPAATPSPRYRPSCLRRHRRRY
jgi:hypothetical protein